MVSNAKFFSEDKKAAAVLKHGVLRRYLAIFGGALSTTSPGRRVGFLDGYAGEGEYYNPTTGRTAEGSPRIALNIARDLATSGATLDCVFVEKDKKAHESLCSVVAGYANANAASTCRRRSRASRMSRLSYFSIRLGAHSTTSRPSTQF
jgi:three-Cys-motif partner protein